MFDINDTKMTGRLGKDADVREVNSADGKRTVINLRIARDRGPSANRVTDWFTIVYWPKTDREIEFLREQLRKGTLVLVQGEFRNRSFTDGEGKEREVTELHAWDVQPESKPKAEQASAPANTATSAATEAPAAAEPAAVAASEPPLPARTNGAAPALTGKPLF